MIYTKKITIPSVDFSQVSTLPSLASQKTVYEVDKKNFALGEDDKLFVAYGEVNGIFPYKYQDVYTRELKNKEYEAVILENDFIYATFLPQLGGRLWSLIDKKTNRELLFKNTVIRPGNLALRNAWVSGGIEWNFGYRGHNPFTCDNVGCAIVDMGNGNKAFRIYEFERVRAMAWQVDFFLKDDSPLLFVRTRLKNDSFKVVPVYWWSNVAVIDDVDQRVIVGADEAYIAPQRKLRRIPRDYFGDLDFSYPGRTKFALDYFWRTPEGRRKYVVQTDGEGYGLMQVSTSLLKGRKQFVWGNSQGGKRWQNFLSGDKDSGKYDEIQCGLAYTQYENLPLPPNSSWEWIECYGPIKIDKKCATGDIKLAQEATEKELNKIISDEELEKLLKDTREMALKKAEKQLVDASPWGNLERLRREIEKERPNTPQLDFGSLGREQESWVSLLKEGTMGQHSPDEVPLSYMRQPYWTDLMRKAVDGKDKNNWYTNYQLGLSYFVDGDIERAEKYGNIALSLSANTWTYYLMAHIMRMNGKHESEIKFVTKMFESRCYDYSVCKEYFRTMYEYDRVDVLIDAYENILNAELKKRGRLIFYYTSALISVGRLREARYILVENGGLQIPDIREGEVSVTELYVRLCEKEAIEQGLPFDRDKVKIPYIIDFRMFAALEDCMN